MKYLFLLILLIPLALAATLEDNTKYNPTESNVTYVIKQTITGITNATVNETCLTINTTNYCNQSATNLTIQLFELSSSVVPPTLIVTSPINTTYTDNNITINFTANDVDNVSDLWFFNGSINVTYINNSPQFIILSDATYTYTFYANDSFNNIAELIRRFTVSTSVPDTDDGDDGGIGGDGGQTTIYDDPIKGNGTMDISINDSIKTKNETLKLKQFILKSISEPITIIEEWRPLSILQKGYILGIFAIIFVLIIYSFFFMARKKWRELDGFKKLVYIIFLLLTILINLFTVWNVYSEIGETKLQKVFLIVLITISVCLIFFTASLTMIFEKKKKEPVNQLAIFGDS